MKLPTWRGLKLPGCLKKPFNIILIIAFWLLVLPRQLFAYIDPGTGSLVIQLIIATFVSGLFIIKTYWRKIKDWFSGKSADQTDNKAVTEKKIEQVDD